MSKRRLSMRSVRELLRLKYDAKLSVRQISQVLKREFRNVYARSLPDKFNYVATNKFLKDL